MVLFQTMKKLMLLLIMGIFLISLTSASISDLKVQKQGECVDLPQTCPDCTYNNISRVLYPNSTSALSNVAMQKDDTFYNYTFCDTSSLGTYKVNGYGDVGGVKDNWNYIFEVTPNGQDFTTGKAISYIGFIVILLFTFLLTMYGASQVRWKHLRSDTGKIITINNFRYIKIFLFAMVYFELMFLFGLSFKFFREANIEGFTEFFNFIYQLFLNLMYPLMIFLIIVVFIIWINNRNLSKKLNLGLDR